MLAAAPSSGQDALAAPVPRAVCDAGSVPETGLQGQVPAADVAAGLVADGFRCNLEVLGRHGIAGGYKVERYVDAAGRECAYYDTTLLFPSNLATLDEQPTGVAVLDMTDPSAPVATTFLQTPAMQTPHESLLLNQRRGLLAAVSGNPVTAPGVVDVYDVSQDCRAPQLQSSTPLGLLGHESGFSPDGLTFWAASLGANTLTAVDLTDPALPTIAYVGAFATHGVTLSDDGRRAYLAAGAGFPRNEAMLPAQLDGVQVLDVSQVQDRVLDPTVEVVGELTWPSVTIPQTALPVTIGGRPYLLEVDEFAYSGTRITGNGERVGAARVIDIADETAPRVVSDVRLEVHQPDVRPSLAGDPGATSLTGGYAGHYCAVPQREDPGIMACSFLASGLRVFDVRDPLAVTEVAYYVAPVPAGGEANSALSSPAFAPERREVWYSDGGSGFSALRLSPSAWPTAVGAPAAPPAPAAPVAPVAPSGASGPASTGAAPAATGSGLAATGPAVPLLGASVLLLGGLALQRRRAG